MSKHIDAIMHEAKIKSESKLIKDTILNPSGMMVKIYSSHACISIRSHSDGFEVQWTEFLEDNAESKDHKDFEEIDEAVEFFCNKRREEEIGADFESAYYWEQYNSFYGVK